MSTQDHPPAQHATMQAYARTGGALYLIIIVIGIVCEALIRGSLIVSGDAAATAQHIIASETLWRVGAAAQLVLLMCATALTYIWYVLLRPVNRNITLLAVFFALVSIALEGVSALHLQAVLVPLTSVSMQGMAPQQLHALAYLSVAAYSQTFGAALIFFGVQCVIVGYLIRQSGFLPKLIGTMLQIAGLCYLANSFCGIVYPPLAHALFPAIMLPALIGELSFCLWLLFKGVNIDAWARQHARADIYMINS